MLNSFNIVCGVIALAVLLFAGWQVLWVRRLGSNGQFRKGK
jgi:hypothetical protein